jgi:uncharacterized protein (TIGR00297 family)
MILNEGVITVSSMLIGILFAALIAGISYRVNFLTLSGSIATFILASFIFGLGGIKWSVPILTFFILSSILSKLRKMKNESVEIYFEKSGVRDYVQVIANGGLGGVLVVINAINPHEIFYMIYLATLSAVCADTWATEIGTWEKTATYNILNLKPVAQGVSGGISVHGTIGAVLGSITILFSGILWIDISYIHYTILIITTGVFGCMIDSILGATIQAQNKCSVCNKVTERNVHCGTEADHFRGYKLINNDVVNFFSGVAGALFLLFLKAAIKI